MVKTVTLLETWPTQPEEVGFYNRIVKTLDLDLDTALSFALGWKDMALN